jgi:hypothetical protein
MGSEIVYVVGMTPETEPEVLEELIRREPLFHRPR